jgi:Flp pilus assembly pilin Flp
MVSTGARRAEWRNYKDIKLMRRIAKQIARDERGATMIEYGFFVLLFGFALLVASPLIRNSSIGTVNTVSETYGAATMPAP